MSSKFICLEDHVQNVIDHNPYLSRRKLQCEAADGHVVLRGQVQSYYQKQMAQESLKKIEGILSINNCLEVTDCA